MSEQYKSFEEVNQQINVKDIILGKDIASICKSAKKLLESADAEEKKGDFIKTYIYLGRYMNLLTQLQRKKDYQNQKLYISNTLGGNKEQTRRMEKLEELQEKIKRSFDAKNKSPVVAPTEPIIVDDSSTKPEQPEIRETVTSKELYEMIENGSNRFMILDCRTNEDFLKSKIDFKFICNVPEELCMMAFSAHKIQQNLPNESKVFWEMRKDRQIIVFVDWHSEHFVRNSPVWYLRNSLRDYDQDFEKLPEMVLLKGGYENWLTTYPMKCTDPHVTIPDEVKKNDSGLDLDGIEYPNLDDITMKDDRSFVLTPSVDRSTKQSAVKAYEKNRSESELLEEKEKIINKSIQNEKELLKLQQDLDSFSDNKENEGDPSKEQETLFAIWQLNTKKKDINLEQETINTELQKVKTTDVSAISKFKDLEERLKIKQDEEKRLREESQRKFKEREEKLKFSRQHKPPHFDDHKTPQKAPRKNELILSPSALSHNVVSPPSYDRSAKPVSQHTQQFYDNKDFSPYYQKVEHGLTGLKNLGNTCYMNSIIQCLSHTLSLKQFLLEGNHEKQINRSNNTRGHIVRTLAAVIKMLWSGECKYISSKHLKAVIGEQENLFCGMDQQDAHEFLVMLIDWLQSDLQTIPMSNYIDQSPSEKAWLEYTKAKESFILRLFYGQIKSTVKCKTCGEESATFDTFSNLSLELPVINIDRCHIMDCFNMYFNGENISGWNCPRCKVPRDAIKKLDISKLPPVLIIHLKRFYADSYSFRKKSVFVEFPYTDLDMLQYVSPKERMTSPKHVYYLYAVSNHYGTMESGHYTAFCRNARQNKWYKFDDHNVSQIDKSDVKSSAAYILFYTYLPESYFMN